MIIDLKSFLKAYDLIHNIKHFIYPSRIFRRTRRLKFERNGYSRRALSGGSDEYLEISKLLTGSDESFSEISQLLLG